MDYLDLDTLTMAGKYLLGATGGLVSYIAGNYLIGKRYFYIYGKYTPTTVISLLRYIGYH